MPDLITILEEPTGATYEALLHFALSRDSLFSLVWRDQLSFDTAARAVATTLEPDLIVSSRTGAWPGTQLSDTLATVNFYRFSSRSLPVLSCVSGVYAWKSPAMPEDLAFYTSDQVPWFGSIAHEADSLCLRPDAVSLTSVSQCHSGLRGTPDPTSGSLGSDGGVTPSVSVARRG